MGNSEKDEAERYLDAIPILLQPLVESAISGKALTSLECLKILNQWDEARKEQECEEDQP